jgi:hypothetical protein
MSPGAQHTPPAHSNVPAHGAPWHTAAGGGGLRVGRPRAQGGSAGEGQGAGSGPVAAQGQSSEGGRRSLEFRSRPKDSMTALPENNF